MEKNPKRFRKSLLFMAKLLLEAILFGIFAYVWWFHYPEAAFYDAGNYLVLFFYAVILFAFTSLYGATRIGILRLGEVIYSFIISLLVVNFIAYVQFSFTARALVPPWELLVGTAVQIVAASLGAYYINKLYFKLYPAREVAVVYSKRTQARQVIDKMAQKKERYRVCVAVQEDAGYEEILKVIGPYASVLLCDVDEKLRHRLFSHCSLESKRIYIVPDFQDVLVRSSHSTQLFDTPVFYCKNASPATEQLLLKRLMDIVFSVLALVVFSPFMLIIALCVKACDGGPVLYKQDRLTRDGRVFRLYKFRSMVVDAEKHSGARLSSVNDDRVTPVGKVIRKIRFDELPQLINILKGDMAVVGPRPERPEIAIQYQEALPEFALRLRVKAGLTGYAQIYGRYNTSIHDKLLLDLLYIENFSIIMDCKMLFMTLKILFMPESTQGIEEGALLPVDGQEKEKN